jgi:alpha-amylase
MGVMLQAFYWDCPKAEDREHQWWAFIESKLPSIAQAGITALWLPPANKAASWKSMGYDPYDYYDLGEFIQKGGVRTWFGSKTELLDLIESAHSLGLQVYADLVFNHNSGADAQELNPIDGQWRWTKFEPKSREFPRDWKCFHPSQYETWDGATFGDMPDLCHRAPLVSRNARPAWRHKFQALRGRRMLGPANVELMTGSMKRMRGRTIQWVRLIFRCAGDCRTCVTVTDSVSVISPSLES